MKLFLRGDTWWVTYGSNPRRRESTGLKDRDEAERYAMRIIAPAMTDSAAALVEKAAQLRRSADEMRCDYMRLDKLFEPSAYQRLHCCKPSGVKSAGEYWRSFVSFCANFGVHDVDGITPKICQGYIGTKGPRSAQCAVIYCRQILRDAGCTRTLFKSVPKRGETTHREPLTPEQIRILLDEVDRLSSVRNRGDAVSSEFPWYVRLLLYTGMRMGDAATLTASMVDSNSWCIRRKMEKTSRTVEFPVHESMRKYLSERLDSCKTTDEPVFPSVSRVYLNDHRTISRHFSRIMDKIGLTGKSGQFCAHCLRATFATLCAENGIPLAVIQSWLGHTSPMVTRIYARIEDMKRKREALKRFPDLG